eukprot:CAMPEP_0198257134 /NCGR_PEP_ID=MMETSP1447-20131203/6878_1 /TAXON_ID=420782 /ORGANISM="Chaetoceros dichaeta, Strain CCMP1751" /LENGTH=381 /DNA_ID=CAMNT_0043943957 /DNA_START=130 /DNA_END=1275 /DNA_ORIENTATION=+
MDRKRSADATTAAAAAAAATKQRKKSKSKQSDCVILDVGGQKFKTSRTTLRSGSTYFSSLFSELWTRDDDDETDENGAYSCFLDQNPTAFGVLLDYMREGVVQLNDLANLKVLLLAEYLGMDGLILAIKVATYINRNPTFSGTEEEAQQAFDAAYGMALKLSVISGLLPKALQGQPEEGGTDYAMITWASLPLLKQDSFRIIAPELESAPEPDDNQFPLLGALNWLHYHGYATLERKMQIEYKDEEGNEKTFSRRYPPSFSSTELHCTQVLIGWKRPKPPRIKTFALLEPDSSGHHILFYAPHGGHEGPVPNIAPQGGVDGRKPRWCTLVRISDDSPLKFLQDRKYVCREKVLEAEFKNHLSDDFRIFSRVLDEDEGVVLP